MKGIAFILCAALLAGCSMQHRFVKQLRDHETAFGHHAGVVIYDPAARKTLVDYNSHAHFTPASNTKILTLYTALHILGDSIPALRYVRRSDSLIIWGTGDPAFLNRNTFDNRRVYNFLQRSPARLFVSSDNFMTDAWGPGWAWDDYPFAFSAERSPFPVFGNVEKLTLLNGRFNWVPALFQRHFVLADSAEGESKLIREIDSNQVTFFPGRKQRQSVWEIPFHCSSDALAELLSDTLKRQVDEISMPLPKEASVINSIPADSLYAPMMKHSDNFIAEQLLLLCAQKLSDTLDTSIAIRFAKDKLLRGLPDELAWADGSGLSRYNLTTPANIVWLWQKLYAEIPPARLLSLLATGGQKGTLRTSYGTPAPWVFGKTGGLSNNIALSGYLKTKKGKVLIFCFMNSNFTAPSREIRSAVERLLTAVRDTY